MLWALLPAAAARLGQEGRMGTPRDLPGGKAGARGDLSQPGCGQGEGMNSPCTGRLWQSECVRVWLEMFMVDWNAEFPTRALQTAVCRC